MGSMPVHDAIQLGGLNLDQATPTGATAAGTGLRLIDGAMRGTHQPVTRAVKKAVGLVIHLHRHMGTTVQIGVRRALIANGKSPAGLTAINHIKGNGFSAIDQIGRIAQGNALRHVKAFACQALRSSQSCSSRTEWAT